MQNERIISCLKIIKILKQQISILVRLPQNEHVCEYNPQEKLI